MKFVFCEKFTTLWEYALYSPAFRCSGTDTIIWNVATSRAVRYFTFTTVRTASSVQASMRLMKNTISIVFTKLGKGFHNFHSIVNRWKLSFITNGKSCTFRLTFALSMKHENEIPNCQFCKDLLFKMPLQAKCKILELRFSQTSTIFLDLTPWRREVGWK